MHAVPPPVPPVPVPAVAPVPALPFVGVMLVYLVLITYVPEISMFLVDMLYPSNPAAAIVPAAAFD